MDIIITSWALNSYLDLKHSNVINDQNYQNIIRPDIMLLKNYPYEVKFQNSKFWSVVTNQAKIKIVNAFKMKWHNLGDGKIQLRLPVGIFANFFLCEAYVKDNPKEEQRKVARFKTHLELIRRKQFTECGRL